MPVPEPAEHKLLPEPYVAAALVGAVLTLPDAFVIDNVPLTVVIA